eukprot:g82135.t1
MSQLHLEPDPSIYGVGCVDDSEDCENKWKGYERYEPDFVIIYANGTWIVSLIGSYCTYLFARRGSVFLTLALRDVLRFTTSVTICEFYIRSDIQFRGGVNILYTLVDQRNEEWEQEEQRRLPFQNEGDNEAGGVEQTDYFPLNTSCRACRWSLAAFPSPEVQGGDGDYAPMARSGPTAADGVTVGRSSAVGSSKGIPQQWDGATWWRMG